MLKSMWPASAWFAGGQGAEKQLAAAERQVEVPEGIRANTEDMGLEAVDI